MSKLTPFKEAVYSISEKSGAAGMLQSLGGFTGEQVYVLAYHRVDLPEHRPWLNPELINASPAQFRAQMELVARNYHPVGIEDVLNAAEGGKKLPRNAVVVTVDDGYLDFQETILPVCRQHGIRPLLFTPTAYVGEGTFWWDMLYQMVYFSGWPQISAQGTGPLRILTAEEKQSALNHLSHLIKQSALEKDHNWLDTLYREFLDQARHGFVKDRCDTLDWDELREASRNGADIAAHTHTHPIVSRISDEQVRQEIRQCRSLLRSELNSDLPVFAYPDGLAADITPDNRRIVREEGFQLAFTMISRRAELDHDPHDYLPRLGTWSKLSLGHFHLRLTPLFSRIQTQR